MRKERFFDQERIAEECNFDSNIKDRRILYEMTGIRMNDTDFLENTTDSDIDELPEDGSDEQESRIHLDLD